MTPRALNSPPETPRDSGKCARFDSEGRVSEPETAEVNAGFRCLLTRLHVCHTSKARSGLCRLLVYELPPPDGLPVPSSRSGGVRRVMHSAFTTHLTTSGCEGISYITSSSTLLDDRAQAAGAGLELHRLAARRRAAPRA